MKTLYVSDLDGTLLRINQRTSEYKNRVINTLVERVAAFGDGKNDVNLFEAADEAYAVANAVPELKQLANAVIGSSDEDGVARWMEDHLKSHLHN